MLRIVSFPSYSIEWFPVSLLFSYYFLYFVFFGADLSISRVRESGVFGVSVSIVFGQVLQVEYIVAFVSIG